MRLDQYELVKRWFRDMASNSGNNVCSKYS